jgi:hypothetical protein
MASIRFTEQTASGSRDALRWKIQDPRIEFGFSSGASLPELTLSKETDRQ